MLTLAFVGLVAWAFISGWTSGAILASPKEYYPSYQYEPDSEDLKTPCAKAANLQESELCAQWRSARAAENSAFWSQWGVLITLGGTIGLIATIWQGRLALERAWEANQIARQSARAELRPYVFNRNLSWLHYGIGKELVDYWEMHVEWANAGHTPTYDLELLAWKYLGPSELPSDYAFDYRDPDPAPSLHIAAGQSLTSVGVRVTADEMKAVQDGDRHLYFWGWAQYRDVLEESPTYRTEFCYKVKINSGDPTRVTSTENIVNFSGIPQKRHNRMI